LLGHDQDWTQQRVVSAMHNGSDANNIFMKNRIPVYLTYFTAVAGPDGELTQFKDLYGHDRRMLAALKGRPIPAGLPDNMEVVHNPNERRAVRRSSRRASNPFASIFDF
jgi:hypothetical protein